MACFGAYSRKARSSNFDQQQICIDVSSSSNWVNKRHLYHYTQFRLIRSVQSPPLRFVQAAHHILNKNKLHTTTCLAALRLSPNRCALPLICIALGAAQPKFYFPLGSNYLYMGQESNTLATRPWMALHHILSFWA